jgi:hypothetical protein
MHQLMRRTALAIVGAGLGLAAAATVAAGPSFAQDVDLIPTSTSYIMEFKDFDAPSVPEAGDEINAHGLLWGSVDQDQQVGSFVFGCKFADETSVDCNTQHYLSGETGFLSFSFGAEYEPSTGIIEMIEREDINFTDGTGDHSETSFGSAWVDHRSGEFYGWRSTLWAPQPNA